MEKTLVSIIVPIYKVEKYLDRCIESLINQTYTNIEIILVDDGSPDKCPQICDKWKKKDTRINVIHKENGGVSLARNIGIENSKGKYIAFVDGDDYINKNMINYLIRGIEKNENINFAYCDINRNSDEFSDEGKYSVEIIEKSKRMYEVFPWRGGIWNGLYKKSVLEDNKIRFNKNYFFGEDLIFVTEYLNVASSKIVHIKNKLYNYAINLNGITQISEKDKKMQNEYNYFKSIKNSVEIIKKYNVFDIEIIQKEYINYLLSIFKLNKNIFFEKELIKELNCLKTLMTKKQRICLILIKIEPKIVYYITKRRKQ